MGCNLVFRLTVIALVFSLPLFAEQQSTQHKSPCWGPNCRVEVDTRPFVAQTKKLKNHSRYAQCPDGIPVPEGMTKLPPGHVYADKGKKTFILPIHENPEKFIQPGDILIDAEPGDMENANLYESLMEGRTHAKLVVRKPDGGLYHLDSPLNHSGSSFDGKPYHILRVREYPLGVTSAAELARWQADPEKRKKLAEWKEKRTKIIEAVSQNAIKELKAGGWGYDDLVRMTEIANPTELQAWQRNFEKKCNEKMHSYYCSEFPAKSYAVLGLPLPDANAIFRMLDRMEEGKIKEKMKETGKSKRQIVSAEIDRVFAENDTMANLSPTKKALAKRLILEYVLAPKAVRNFAAMALKEFTKGSFIPISPSDLVANINDKDDGYLSYAGTWVGANCIGGKEQELDQIAEMIANAEPALRGLFSRVPPTEETENTERSEDEVLSEEMLAELDDVNAMIERDERRSQIRAHLASMNRGRESSRRMIRESNPIEINRATLSEFINPPVGLSSYQRVGEQLGGESVSTVGLSQIGESYFGRQHVSTGSLQGMFEETNQRSGIIGSIEEILGRAREELSRAGEVSEQRVRELLNRELAELDRADGGDGNSSSGRHRDTVANQILKEMGIK